MRGQKIKEKILLFKVRNYKDSEAFGQIYDLYVNAIYRFVYFKINSKEEAEDLTSDIFLKLWNYLISETSKIDDFKPFIYKVARNTVIDYYRRNKDQNVVLGDREVEISDEQKNLFEKLAMKDEIDEIKKALNKLKAEYKEIIVLRYIENLKISEIALIIGKSKGASRVLLHRATNTLRELVNGEKSIV